MIHAKVTSKGQITLPLELREKLRLVPGSRVNFEERADGSFVMRRKTGDIRDLKGILKKDGAPVSLDGMKRAIEEEAVARLLRSAE